MILAFTPMALNRPGCLRGSSTISLIWASCLRQPPMSSYPMSFRLSSSSWHHQHMTTWWGADIEMEKLYRYDEITHTSRLIGSPSQWMMVSGATMQWGAGSVSITLNSTALMPPLTRKISPTEKAKPNLFIYKNFKFVLYTNCSSYGLRQTTKCTRSLKHSWHISNQI